MAMTRYPKSVSAYQAAVDKSNAHRRAMNMVSSDPAIRWHAKMVDAIEAAARVVTQLQAGSKFPLLLEVSITQKDHAKKLSEDVCGRTTIYFDRDVSRKWFLKPGAPMWRLFGFLPEKALLDYPMLWVWLEPRKDIPLDEDSLKRLKEEWPNALKQLQKEARMDNSFVRNAMSATPFPQSWIDIRRYNGVQPSSVARPAQSHWDGASPHQPANNINIDPASMEIT